MALGMTSPSPPLPTSPLDIPELLSKIHSFLDNHTIQHSVIHVCRQWFLINRHRIRRELIWEYHYQNECMERVLPSLPFIERVDLFFRSVTGQQQEYPDADSDLVRNQSTAITKHALFEPTPILEFSISGTYPNTRLYELMPFLSNVTRLRVEQRMKHHVYPDQIFRGCPHLLSLYVGSGSQVEMFREWLPLPPDQQHSLPLLSLVLDNAYLKQAKLEEFLQFTPNLTELQLSNLSIKGLTAIAEDGMYDCKRLIKCVKRLRVPLKTFHFSVYEQSRQSRDCLVDEELFRSICQDSREWSFATGDMTPQLMRNIGYLPNTITTLNMVNRNTVFCDSTSKLHQFLCTSPQLLHLRIPKTAYRISYMDLYHRIPSALVGDRSRAALEAEASRNPDPGVWACRRLQTLHIAFEISPGMNCQFRAEHSRIVFGYIAKVCPELRELVMQVPNYRHGHLVKRYELAGGFCLLAGLKYLERLRMGCAVSSNLTNLYDLDWMALPRRTEHTKNNQEVRRKIIAQWRGVLLGEANKDRKRMAKERSCEFLRTERNTLGWEYCDDVLKEELHRLGTLLDVKMMLERIDGSSESESEEGNGMFRCWPCLLRIDFGGSSPFGLVSAQQELTRLFPPSPEL
ncbi:MAG: hypothetical protein J3R72DRAFT_520864 [Linnemannia gamsii]|nr:MAG: hypothetical protein J3R72DRAFT_520864 [Linnemannia gamsii]